jgi:hypothetical protein
MLLMAATLGKYLDRRHFRHDLSRCWPLFAVSRFAVADEQNDVTVIVWACRSRFRRRTSHIRH